MRVRDFVLLSLLSRAAFMQFAKLPVLDQYDEEKRRNDDLSLHEKGRDQYSIHALGPLLAKGSGCLEKLDSCATACIRNRSCVQLQNRFGVLDALARDDAGEGSEAR